MLTIYATRKPFSAQEQVFKTTAENLTGTAAAAERAAAAAMVRAPTRRACFGSGPAAGGCCAAAGATADVTAAASSRRFGPWPPCHFHVNAGCLRNQKKMSQLSKSQGIDALLASILRFLKERAQVRCENELPYKLLFEIKNTLPSWPVCKPH